MPMISGPVRVRGWCTHVLWDTAEAPGQVQPWGCPEKDQADSFR